MDLIINPGGVALLARLLVLLLVVKSVAIMQPEGPSSCLE
jgi:hypothetical protein